MNVLVIGSGGREHAIGWKINKSPKLQKLYFAPGNGGTSELGENVNVETDKHGVVIAFCEDRKIDLVIIGPDKHLAQGLTDSLENAGIKVFGPTRNASRIEWSKEYAKKFMLENDIPTARYETFSNSPDAINYIQKQELPIVIKANGLAQGKGVVIAKNLDEAERAIVSMIDENRFGEAGKSIVIEEYLEGQEISVHAFCDREHAVLFPSSQDHKRRYEADLGPNTGGMGTVAPVDFIAPEILDQIKEEIINPTLGALKGQGYPFVGILFPGVMLTSDGPKVIEFNARFGDPETQVYLPLLKTDLLEIMLACVNGDLKNIKIEWDDKYSTCIVLVSDGYPKDYKTDFKIDGLEVENKSIIFHAGTTKKEGGIYTSGGRVLNVVSVAKTLSNAIKKAYTSVDTINFKGKRFRKDIGQKVIKNENNTETTQKTKGKENT